DQEAGNRDERSQCPEPIPDAPHVTDPSAAISNQQCIAAWLDGLPFAPEARYDVYGSFFCGKGRACLKRREGYVWGRRRSTPARAVATTTTGSGRSAKSEPR